MRLVEITARDILPIKLAQIKDMSDTVVIAGPNGVGKTRLIARLLQHVQNAQVDPQFSIRLRATNDAERLIWGQEEIATDSAEKLKLVREVLQKNRRRSNFTSSFLNFESNRTIQRIDPYNFTWDFGDPFDEEIGWNFGMTDMTSRFNDVIHSIFRRIRNQREAITQHYEELLSARIAALADAELSSEQRGQLEKGVLIDPAKFPDVLALFKQAFRQLLAPKELMDPEVKNQQLFYRSEAGDPLPITALSSGEREVVNIVFDFLLRAPSDCVAIFDEPELHLHPELSYRLIQTLRRTGKRNQFIFCTHSAEIITASLENTVIFIGPAQGADFNQAIVVREDDETHQALKLLGQSIGIISLGKKLVLIEGAGGSLDKQTYGAILRDRFPSLVLVPSGGKGLLRSFSTLSDQVLNKTIWGVQFFMLCDRDALPLDDPTAIEKSAAGRIRMLKRYHLENYFLDEHTIAALFKPLVPEGDWLRSPQAIRQELRQIAQTYSSYATALSAAAHYREEIGNVSLMPKGCDGKTADELADMMLVRSKAEQNRITTSLNETKLSAYVKTLLRRIEQSLAADTDEWKELIPGKPILGGFCAKTPLRYDAFRTAYINASETMTSNPFAEVISIFDQFSRA